MGVAKEWAVVFGLGTATFLVLLALPDPEPPAGARGFAFIEPFEGHVRAHAPTRVLLIGRVDAHAEGPDHIDWRTPHLAVATTAPTTPDCACVGSLWHDVPPAEEPRLGRGGYNATRVTVHVFDAATDLVFSNAKASEQARLTRTLSPQQLPTGVWYVGANATAPPGTQKPPLAAQAFLPQVRHLIEGLPVGGVATTETDALATWYGTLYVTLRVDELVHAP